MKNKLIALLVLALLVMTLSGCGKDPELAAFRNEFEEFCTDISGLGTSIDSINASDQNADEATQELLGYLDQLELEFEELAKLDFPTEFDYLEKLAVEASEYMTEAVKSYHEAYGSGGYNEYTAKYAQENYSRAYKRIQVIISLLHGKTPDDVDLKIEYDEN